ncbi:MAG: hypothetical protein WC932_06360 [archaeon]
MSYIDKIVEEIQGAKNNESIKKTLLDVYFATQYDSAIRKEFDQYAQLISK